MIYNGVFEFHQFPKLGFLTPQPTQQKIYPFEGIESSELVTGNQLNGWHLMEFTGFKDCQSNDIYEGDIIEFDRVEWGGNDNIHVVSWDGEDGSWNWGGGHTRDMGYRTVIGNIHQHYLIKKPTNMNYYLISQMVLDTATNQEKWYRVGFAYGENKDNAVNNYVTLQHPEDKDRRNFVSAFLTATQTEEATNNDFNKTMIAMCREQIKTWL